MTKCKFISSLSIVMILSFICNIPTIAQKGNFLHKIEDYLLLRQLKKIEKIDTNYIKIPQEKFFATFNYTASRISHSAYSPEIDVVVDDELESAPSINSSIDVHTTQKLGFGLSYMGLGAKVSFDLAKRKGNKLSLNYYGNKFGVEFRWQYMDELQANVRIKSQYLPEDIEDHSEDEDGFFRFKRFSINAYYAFNSKHFSYPAAISMKNIQKHSSGSILLGCSLFSTSTDMGDVIIYNYLFDAKRFTLKTKQFSFGPGYAYNYVMFKNRVMLHATFIPMILFSKGELNLTKGWVADNKRSIAELFYDPETDGDFEEYMSHLDEYEITYNEDYGKAISKKSDEYNHYIDVSFGGQARLALVFNLSNHFVLGSRAQYNFYNLGNKNMFGSETSEWFVNTTLGYRF